MFSLVSDYIKMQEEKINIAMDLNRKGTEYYINDDYDNAITSYKESVELLISLYGKHSGNYLIAKTYSNLSAIYLKNNEYENATDYCKKSLKTLIKNTNTHPMDIAKCHSNMGSINEANGEHNKAISSYKKALSITLKQEDAASTHIAKCYDNLGKVYESKHDYKKAISVYEKGLSKLLESENSHLELAECFFKLSVLHYLNGNNSLSQLYILNAIELYDDYSSTDDELTQVIYFQSFIQKHYDTTCIYEPNESTPFLNEYESNIE